MAMVKVINDNVHDFTDNDWRGAKLFIPAGRSVEMDHDEARQFLAKFHPPVKDEGVLGGYDPKSFKKLRIAPLSHRGAQETAPKKAKTYTNHATGKTFDSIDEYNKDIEDSKHMAVTDKTPEENEFTVSNRKGAAHV